MTLKALQNTANSLLSIRLILLFLDGIIRLDMVGQFDRLSKMSMETPPSLPPFVVAIIFSTAVILHTFGLYSVNDNKLFLIVGFVVYLAVTIVVSFIFEVIPEVNHMNDACSLNQMFGKESMCSIMTWNAYTDIALSVSGLVLLLVLLGYCWQLRNSEGNKARAAIRK